MREIADVVPAPTTELEILRHGLAEIAQDAPGGHADPNNPCYAEKRRFKDFAGRILDAADRAAALAVKPGPRPVPKAEHDHPVA